MWLIGKKNVIIDIQKLKNQNQISQMRVAGQLAAEVLEMITPYVVPGVSTEELDKRCYDFIVNEQKAIPANVGYNGFEKTICFFFRKVSESFS